MSGTEKIGWSSSDLIRYKAGKMTDKERNAFEKEMQRDPFLADALEGLELVTSGEAETDLEFIRGKVSGKRRKIHPIIYSGAAAAVVLLIISSVWLLRTDRENGTVQMAATEQKAVSIDSTGLIALVPEADKLRESEKKDTEALIGEKPPVSASRQKSDTIKAEAAAKEEVVIAEDIVQFFTVTDIIRTDTTISAKGLVPENEARAKMAGVSLQPATGEAPRITGIIYSKDDSLPLPGVAVSIKGMANINALSGLDGRFTLPVKPDSNIFLVANFIGMMTTEVRAGTENPLRIEMVSDLTSLDEVVVVGYGSQRKAAVTGSVSTISSDELSNTSKFRAPEPVCGYVEFNEYVKKNLIYPVDVKGGSREVVVVDLPLSETGKKGEPVIVKSPGKTFSDEAIRVILAGPEWTPSMMNGIPGADTVRVRIVFQK